MTENTAPTPAVPEQITQEQVRAALAALGLDPTRVYEVTLTHDTVGAGLVLDGTEGLQDANHTPGRRITVDPLTKTVGITWETKPA